MKNDNRKDIHKFHTTMLFIHGCGLIAVGLFGMILLLMVQFGD